MSSPQRISQAYQPGQSVVSLIWDMSQKLVWNTSSLSYETYNPANVTNYRIALVDDYGIGIYSALPPSQLAGTIFLYVNYNVLDYTNPIGSGEMMPPDSGPVTTPPTSPSVVAMVNKGLIFLGQNTIATLSENSKAATLATSIYDSVLNATLRAHYWKFATYVDALALLTLADFDPTNNPGFPLPGWQFAYSYPALCMMIRRIFDNTYCDPSIQGIGFVSYTWDSDFGAYYDRYKDILYRYRLMQAPNTSGAKVIAAHINPAFIEYTYRVTDPLQWDSQFTDAMSFNMAAQLARPLTGNTELGAQALQMSLSIVSEAKRLDAQEDHSPHQQMSRFQRARM